MKLNKKKIAVSIMYVLAAISLVYGAEAIKDERADDGVALIYGSLAIILGLFFDLAVGMVKKKSKTA